MPLSPCTLAQPGWMKNGSAEELLRAVETVAGGEDLC